MKLTVVLIRTLGVMIYVVAPCVASAQPPDSVGVSYENGKLNLPYDLPKGSAKENIEDKAKTRLPTNSKQDLQNQSLGKAQKKLSDQTNAVTDKQNEALRKKDEHVQKAQHRADSIQQIIVQGEDIASQLKNGTVPQRVYSNRALKKLYDSLGIGKLDSVRALTPIKKDMGKDDLLKALNQKIPEAPIKDPMDKPSDLAGLAGKETSLPQVPDLANVKLPDSTLHDLMPARAFRFPSDSLGIIDSMRNINLSREKLMMKEQNVDEQLKQVVVKDKPKFWDKTYFEGVLGFTQGKDLNTFQFAPAMGYHIKENLSVGLGPNIYLKKVEKKWNANVGYRAFVKYEIFNQLAYLHVEDLVDLQVQSLEDKRNNPHSILAGAGYVQPIFGSVAINLCVLYRVNNDSYAGGQLSPWVIRLGLSTRKNTDKKPK